MAIATPEQVHRYPRRITLIIEVLCAALVLVAMVRWGRALLQFVWDANRQGITVSIVDFADKGWFRAFVNWINGSATRPRFSEIAGLAPSFILLAGTLFAILFIRNFFPTIRTSGRGLLVEWSNSWLPVGWEQVKGLRVTEDLAGERFVLLLQTDMKALTGWHRFYSVLYRLSFRRGIIITSAISNFLPLAQTLQSELDQVARQTSKPPVRLDEKASSPLFQLLLSPAGFFSLRSKTDQEYVNRATEAARSAQPGRVASLMATYPKRIQTLLVSVAAALAVFGILRSLSILRRWMGTAFDGIGKFSFFQMDPLPRSVSLWWMPVAAVLVLALLLPILMVIRNILPDVESRPQGLAVRYFNRWLLVPWGEITAVKSTSFSEANHVVLIQTTNKALRLSHRISSILFDGTNARGILLTSALSAFEPLLQQIVLEVSRGQRNVEREDGLLVEDAPAWFLRLILKPSEAIDRLVSSYAKKAETTKLTYQGLLGAATPMLWLAGLSTTILLAEQLINNGRAPAPGRIIGALFFFLFCMIEWPLAAGIAQLLEQNLEDDAHRARPFYVYPIVQLPRLILLVAILIFVLLGVPLLPALLWLGAAVWSFLLTAGLWEGLYGWSSTKLLTMGAIPALYQFFTLLVWARLT